MGIIEKEIGRLSQWLGDYDGTRTYMRRNRVTLYGSEYESLVDGNTHAPATLDEQTGHVTVDEHWKVISNGSDAYAIALQAQRTLAQLAAQWADQDQRMLQMLETINEKQLDVGAVPTDEVPTAGSSNRVPSGALYEVLTNPQKGFVDGTPVNGSRRLVTSGGVYSHLGAVPVVLQEELSAEVSPNVINRWGVISALSVTFAPPISGMSAHYFLEFTAGSAGFTLTLPTGVRWSEEPDWEEGHTYQVSIMDGLAVGAGWEAAGS